jgi:hypothetical protein
LFVSRAVFTVGELLFPRTRLIDIAIDLSKKHYERKFKAGFVNWT